MHVGPDPVEAAPAQAAARARPWYSKLLSLCFVIFCFEIGVFLVVFPWLDNAWESNHVAALAPWLADMWGNPFFRGALSGLGMLNIYISLAEVLRMIRGHVDERNSSTGPQGVDPQAGSLQ